MIEVEPERGVLNGELFLPLECIDRYPLVFYFHKNDLKILKVLSGNSPVAFDSSSVAPGVSLNNISIKPQRDLKEIRIFFEARFSSPSASLDLVRRGVSFSALPVMGVEGAFLPESAYWFPRLSGHLSIFDLTASLPEDYSAVMEGSIVSEMVREKRRIIRYKTQNRSEGINLVLGKYHIEKTRYRGVDISTYLYADDAALSKTYLDKTKEYLDLYDSKLPPYPYEKFVVVENFLPTGFGFPSFTLLGSAVIRLPFIPATSLGHEFLHNWWGNGVYVDINNGNWAEALTTYTADHLYKEKFFSIDEAAVYRFKALTNYANYAASDVEETALSEFMYDSSPAGRAVGYSKGMMVFHMLRGLVGDELFYKSLWNFYENNSFRRAGWPDLRTAFEETTGRELGWFFDQWLFRRGAPVLGIKAASSKKVFDAITSEIRYRVSLTVEQKVGGGKGLPYRLTVPLIIETAGGRKSFTVELNAASTTFNFIIPEEPESIELDPMTDIFRLLSPEEIPPSIASVLGSPKSLLVLPSKAHYRARYEGAARSLSADYGLRIVADKDVAADAVLAARPQLIFGAPGENSLLSDTSLIASGEISINNGGFTIDGELYNFSDTVLVAALNRGKARAVIFAGSLSATKIARISKRVAHLTSKGYLIFSEGGALKKGTGEGKKLLRYDFDK